MILYVDDEAGILFLGAALIFAEDIDQTPIITIGVSVGTGIIKEVQSTVRFFQEDNWNPIIQKTLSIVVGDGFPESIDRDPVASYFIDQTPRIVQSVDQNTRLQRTFGIPTVVQQAIDIGLNITTKLDYDGQVVFLIEQENGIVQVRPEEVTVTQSMDREVQLD